MDIQSNTSKSADLAGGFVKLSNCQSTAYLGARFTVGPPFLIRFSWGAIKWQLVFDAQAQAP